jgi:RNA polymerase sigma-70 factor, ECF subfamily
VDETGRMTKHDDVPHGREAQADGEAAPGAGPVAGQDPRRLLAALLPDLRAYARFLARDRTGADDLVQDTVLRALGALSQFQPGTNFKGWLFTILRNTFYEQARRRRRERAAMERTGTMDEAAAPHQLGHADLADLQRLLWKLPPLLREALVLVGAQELSYEEAASICGVPVGTMKARVSRARSQLSKAAAGEAAAPAAG